MSSILRQALYNLAVVGSLCVAVLTVVCWFGHAYLNWSETRAWETWLLCEAKASAFDTIPFWVLLAVSSFLPMADLLLHETQRLATLPSLPPANLCPSCGYDLRASRERCPECGAAFPAAEIIPQPPEPIPPTPKPRPAWQKDRAAILWRIRHAK